MNDTVAEKLERLRDAMVEDMLAMSDEEMLAEMRENGLDPAEVAQKLRVKISEAIANAKLSRVAHV